MAYEKLNLTDGSVFTAAHVTHVENGVVAAETAANTAATNAANAQSTANAAKSAADTNKVAIAGAGTYDTSKGDIQTRLNTLESGSGSGSGSDVTKAYVDQQDTALETKITAAQTTANTANSTANAAKTVAEDAQTTADSANTLASTASTTASTAKVTAETAQSTADTAKNTADTANSTANTAKTNAATAQSTANTAKSTADTNKTAISGMDVYDTSKGDIQTRLNTLESAGTSSAPKIVFGHVSAYVTSGKEATLDYSSAGFTSVPMVFTSYSTDGANPSVNGFIKVYNKTTTSALLTLSAAPQANVAVPVDWAAIGN